MTEEDDFQGIEIEEEEVTEKFTAKPGIEFNFDNEDDLKAFMKALAPMNVINKDVLCFVKNVSFSFFKGFHDLTAAVMSSEDNNDDLSD
jgi:hypothetical protein